MLRDTLINVLIAAAISGGTTFLVVTPILKQAYRNDAVWTKEVQGIKVYYQLAPENTELDGQSIHNPVTPCKVVVHFNPLEIDLFYRSAQHYQTAILAHETGHCLATKVLGDARGKYRTPEQFAWAYARAHFAECRLNASAYLPGKTTCPAPSPYTVTPDRYPVPDVDDPGAPPEYSPNPTQEWPPLERWPR